MGGKGRSPLLAVASPDPVLSFLSALGLAASAGTALVVDLVGDVRTSGRRTLSTWIDEGPRLAELSPGHAGVALLPGGPVAPETAAELVDEIAVRWPRVVVRCHYGDWAGPTVPVWPLYPGLLEPAHTGAAVWQPWLGPVRPPGPGPVLPRLRPSLAGSLLSGRLPPRSRWIRSWSRVWELPWA